MPSLVGSTIGGISVIQVRSLLRIAAHSAVHVSFLLRFLQKTAFLVSHRDSELIS